MDLIHFEDVAVGETSLFGDYEMTKDEIVEFARQFDPQPFHLDEEAAKGTLLGGLAASGWHTAAVSMRLLYDGFVHRAASMGGLGIDELKWQKPVRPGDRLSLRRTVLEKRESQSRPEMGIITSQTDVLNQHGDIVMSYRAPVVLRRRGVAAQVRPAVAAPELVKTNASEPPERDFLSGSYFDDLAPGQRSVLEPYTFEKEAIIAFAKKYDPQPFHVDEAAARKSHFGGLVASGWHTGAVYMGQLIKHRTKRFAEIQAKGGNLPEPGPSPGFTDLRWRAPVYAGDTLSFTSEVIDKRKVSRPGWGLVFFHNKGFNQYGRLVFEFRSIAFWQLRP